jgi:Holliday junction resolvase RusA-like endonuclease
MLDFIADIEAMKPVLVREAFVPWLPPSINRGYTIIRWGKKTTLGSSKVLKAFKKNAGQSLGLTWGAEKDLDSRKGYLIELTFNVKETETKAWRSCHDQKVTDKARWARRDVSNWIKFAEDIAATAAGLDDSANLVVIARKVKGPEGFTVRIYRLEGV